MNQPDVTAIFVYGTLKQGQCRERCWPHPPLKVEPATTRGSLYDLGPFPAMVSVAPEVADLIEGQLWHFLPDQMPETRTVLDEIEDAAVGGPQIYRRTVVQCRTESGETVQAETYFYCRVDELRGDQQIHPDPQGLCRWPASSS